MGAELMTVGENMTEAVHEQAGQPRSYRTLTRDDATALRVARYRELEREHFACGFPVEETGQETAEDQRRRLDIEARLRHHEAVLWPEAEQAHDGHGCEPETGPRGTQEGCGEHDGSELGEALRHTRDDGGEANTDDGPVEPDPELVGGALVHHHHDESALLDDEQALGEAADDVQADLTEDSGGRHADSDGDGYIDRRPFEYQRSDASDASPTPLQRTSHFPSRTERN